ncbi:hypothetical protein VTN00DRAFT_4773 [Thermoascus crustaceus]|uniref:uncharacterized protein n=1 Tax=Thermoascus crustaceus TaxID=5088 RepID=UPI0037449631
MGRLEGKVALITGAGSGFGEAIAKSFTREGAHVIIADIAVENGKRVASDIEAASSVAQGHGTAIFMEFDCTKQQAWRDGLELAKQKFGTLDIIVNNAGTTYRKRPSIEVTEAEFDNIINVNVKSIYQSVVVVMPYFVKRKAGVFLNTSSVAGARVRPGQVFYGGTKGFVNTITQGLAAEWGPHGIRVNSICPLRSPTGLLEMFSGVPDTPEERARFSQTVPLRRMGDAQDVANAAVYLPYIAALHDFYRKCSRGLTALFTDLHKHENASWSCKVRAAGFLSPQRPYRPVTQYASADPPPSASGRDNFAHISIHMPQELISLYCFMKFNCSGSNNANRLHFRYEMQKATLIRYFRLDSSPYHTIFAELGIVCFSYARESISIHRLPFNSAVTMGYKDYILTGLKRESSGKYYYDDSDVPRISIPIADETQGLRLSKKQLDEWFKINPTTMPTLPKTLVCPDMESEPSDSNILQLKGWHHVNGSVAVYEPVEWVPVVREVRRFPKSELPETIKRDKTTIEKTKLYGKVESSLEASAGGSYAGMKVEARAKVEGSAEASLETEKITKEHMEGTLGEKPLFEVAVGMLLRVKEVYRFRFLKDDLLVTVKLTPVIDQISYDLTWNSGPSWSDIHVQDRDLKEVKELQARWGCRCREIKSHAT